MKATARIALLLVLAALSQPSRAAAGSGTAANLRDAIVDLTETFGARYPRGAEFISRLDAMGTEPSADDLAALRREALLANPLLDFDRLLVIERAAETPKHLPQNWDGNSSLFRGEVSNRIAVLSHLRTQPSLTTVLEPPSRKLITDVDLHPGADRMLFSMVGRNDHWQVFEMALDGSAPKALPLIEDPEIDNYDACYLPGGDIIFTSTATYHGVPCVQGSSHIGNFYRFSRADGGIRRLTFDQEHNWNPTVLHDGRIMYLRWEYSDLPHSNSRILMQMNPDGTNQTELYGSGSYFPNAYFYARPVPGHPSRVVGIVGGHHGVARAGRLIMLDPQISRTEAEGVVHEFPHRGKVVQPLVKDQLVEGVWPQFLMPWPLSEKHVIVACKPSPDALWGIYLVDVFDNLTLIHESPGNFLFEPVPWVSAEPAPVIPDRSDPGKADATVLLTDIYQGPGLEGLPRGSVRQLRVVEYSFSPRNTGGMIGGVGMDGPWDIRRVIGTVPVEEDGSAHFKIPAQTPVMVQPLDEQGQALQLMRSWFTAMPGERVSCVGCHEGMSRAPSTAPPMAASRPPVEISAGWHGPPRGFSYQREVQPVLDRHCVPCHGDGEGQAGPYLKGDRWITDWKSQISGSLAAGVGGKFTVSYAELHRYIRRPGIESDMRMLSPMEYHFSTTDLGRMLRDGHHGVNLDRESFDRIVTWADLNAPFHGTWSEMFGTDHVRPRMDRILAFRKLYSPSGPALDLEVVPELPPYDRTPVAISPRPAAAVPVQTVRMEIDDPAPAGSRTLDLGDGVAIEWIQVPGGRWNGDSIGSFWMSKTEVTNAQFRRFKPGHHSRDEARHGYQFGRRGYDTNAADQPAVRVSWNEADAYARWLRETHAMPARLPSGREWEWACRAGSTGAFYFGAVDADYSAFANLGDRTLKEFAACTARNDYHAAEPLKDPNRYDDWIPRDDRFYDRSLISARVASYQANAWGLHDMIGNVWEWTTDATPAGLRIARGGSWRDRPQLATVTSQVAYQPYQRVFHTGIRLIMTDDPAATAAQP